MKTQIFGAIAISAATFLTGCAHKPAPVSEAVRYPYHTPLTSPGTKFGGLPAAVQNSIRAEAGTAPIYDIRKSDNSGGVVYKVLFEDPVLYPPLYLKSDGSILYPDMRVAVGASQDTFGELSGGPVSGVKLGDLPNNVIKTIHEKAPTAEVAWINKLTMNRRTYYQVSFKDAVRNRPLLIDEEGALVAGNGGEDAVRPVR